MLDPEIEAMGQVVAALDKLGNNDARARVLRWASDRYGVPLAVSGPARPETGTFDGRVDDMAPRGADIREASEPVYEAFVDFFDAVDPKSDVDKALTAAYWLQVFSKQPSWQSLRVNNLLKDMGHGVANVTSALRTAQERKPALVRQVHKSGRSQQSWKTYKLTTSGVSHVRRRLGLPQTVPVALQDQGEEME
jgi:hypothetical protein